MAKHSTEVLWKIKKESGILKFTLFTEKEKSALVFEAVPIIEGNARWESEIAVGLNVEEIGKALDYIRTGAGAPVSFTHELERKIVKGEQPVTVSGLKTLSFEMPDKSSARIKLKVDVNNQEIRNVSLNLNSSDLIMLEILFRKSIERIMGF